MPEVITTNKLIRKVAKVSDYFLYEVEDVLKAFRIVVREELLKGNQIQIEDLFRVHIERSKRKNIYTATHDVIYLSPGRKKLKFKVNEAFRKQIYSDMNTPHFKDLNEKDDNASTVPTNEHD